MENLRAAMLRLLLFLFCSLSFAAVLTPAAAQTASRKFSAGKDKTIEIRNSYGRLEVVAAEIDDGEITIEPAAAVANLSAIVSSSPSAIRIEPVPAAPGLRIDISVRVPSRSRIRLETGEGEIRISGNFASVEAKTSTGTIITDIPTDDISYQMQWSQSRPRVVSDIELERAKERSAGRFVIKGTYRANQLGRNGGSNGIDSAAKSDAESAVSLNFSTQRGIVLLNVPPAEVMNNLGEKPLTEAAKAIIRSGDSLLMESIRRASPKYFGEYLKTLRPLKAEPSLSMAERTAAADGESREYAAFVRAFDAQNRAVAGLKLEDFQLEAGGRPIELLDVRPSAAPVNLVLLLDVSGSVENYTTFIRKAARAFIEAVDPRDRVSIIIFNEDVKPLVGFTSDKRRLSESLDSFDAGGGTAYYDAIAYTLAETLRPLKGERTAIVILTDGDDNRSFLPFESLLGSIQESGALIYPLYVPTGLIAAAEASPASPDPLRERYLGRGLTSRAESEGKRLAAVSGGIYYPISRLSQIDEAYADIVSQLRTAYELRFRAAASLAETKRAAPPIKVRVLRPNVFAQITSLAPGN